MKKQRRHKTDFTEFELSQFDINKEKFELFLKKIK